MTTQMTLNSRANILSNGRFTFQAMILNAIPRMNRGKIHFEEYSKSHWRTSNISVFIFYLTLQDNWSLASLPHVIKDTCTIWFVNADTDVSHCDNYSFESRNHCCISGWIDYFLLRAATKIRYSLQVLDNSVFRWRIIAS